MTAVPPSEASSLPRSVALPSDSQAIEVDQRGACALCTYGKVCGLFPQTAREAYPTPGIPCRTYPPAAEAVDHLSPTAVGFEDPPGVKGTGVLSGGPNPANGVLTFVPIGAPDRLPGAMTYEATCTLPETGHALCAVVLDDFLARYGKR